MSISFSESELTQNVEVAAGNKAMHSRVSVRDNERFGAFWNIYVAVQPQSLYTSHKVSCTEGRLRRGLDCAWLPLGSFSTSVVFGFEIEPSVTCRFSAPLACITAFWIALPNRACAPNFDSFSEPAFTASLTDGRRRRGCRVVSAVSSWLGRLVDGGVSTTLDFFRGPCCRSPLFAFGDTGLSGPDPSAPPASTSVPPSSALLDNCDAISACARQRFRSFARSSKLSLFALRTSGDAPALNSSRSVSASS